jgi:hypothetical protein
MLAVKAVPDKEALLQPNKRKTGKMGSNERGTL